uniref:Deoxyribonuclease TATDN1 n=1 Tax=Branchiostoma floridae TaxID=7739 RepID=C3ZGQ3_BRAFL|eukprot:XP_002592268.1 hypothetical protein BRAFLDRAFT_70999 [Branchiostoma floridae]
MLPALVDIGANLTNRCFQRDLPAVLQRARDVSVQKIMVTGTSLRASRDALKLARAHPGALYSTAGIHPHDAKFWTDDSLQDLEALLARPECIHPHDAKTWTDESLQELEKLVAHPECVAVCGFPNVFLFPVGFLCKDKRPNGVQWMLEQRLIPLDRLMVESDAPYMYPNIKKLPKETQEAVANFSLNMENFQHCGYKRNEPCSVAVTAAVIAACMGVGPDVVAQATTENATKVFKLG